MEHSENIQLWQFQMGKLHLHWVCGLDMRQIEVIPAYHMIPNTPL